MSRIARLRSALLLAALAALAAVPAAATSIVPVSDEDLVDTADLVVEGTIESELPNVDGQAATHWVVAVDALLKGELKTSHVVVRVPGGRTPDGFEVRIAGAPSLSPGVQALLFLGAERNGARSIVDFPQGGFVIGKARRRTLALRDFSQVNEPGLGPVGAREPLRDAQRFSKWIDDRARGQYRSSDYIVRPRQSELRSISSEYNLILWGGYPARWFDFDSGGSVTFMAHESGFHGLAGGGTAEIQRALAAWTAESSTPVRLSYGGTTAATGGLESRDDQNVILWNDPNDEMEGRYDCGRGGTLAIGSYWGEYRQRGSFGGKNYIRIQHGDVVFNDGVECIRNSKYIESVVAHEIGHTLGLDHSTENPYESNAKLRTALMSWYRNRLLGAQLGADDVEALRLLYLPGTTGSWSSGPASSCPGDRLCLLGGRFVVTGYWENQFDGTDGWANPIPSTDLAGFLYFTDPSNIELAVKVVDFGSEVKVFYSQLTNLKFTLYVTDTATGRVKSYTNTAGDCGAIDNDFQAGPSSVVAGPMSLALPAIVGGTCQADATTLCLLDGRFALTVDWRNQFTGAAGSGMPRKLSNLSGAFAFDNASNLELLIKTLDFGDHVLVLYGALSNLEYTIRVTETASGRSKTYSNPAGKFCGGIDNNF